MPVISPDDPDPVESLKKQLIAFIIKLRLRTQDEVERFFDQILANRRSNETWNEVSATLAMAAVRERLFPAFAARSLAAETNV
jgi:hypothetical protein